MLPLTVPHWWEHNRNKALVSAALALPVAVYLGANSYIGNGPNFMVKAVAEEAGVKMPSFFGYMLYSVGILIPLFVVLTLLCSSGRRGGSEKEALPPDPG